MEHLEACFAARILEAQGLGTWKQRRSKSKGNCRSLRDDKQKDKKRQQQWQRQK
jgi:hypothetical protein